MRVMVIIRSEYHPVREFGSDIKVYNFNFLIVGFINDSKNANDDTPFLVNPYLMDMERLKRRQQEASSPYIINLKEPFKTTEYCLSERSHKWP